MASHPFVLLMITGIFRDAPLSSVWLISLDSSLSNIGRTPQKPVQNRQRKFHPRLPPPHSTGPISSQLRTWTFGGGLTESVDGPLATTPSSSPDQSPRSTSRSQPLGIAPGRFFFSSAELVATVWPITAMKMMLRIIRKIMSPSSIFNYLYLFVVCSFYPLECLVLSYFFLRRAWAFKVLLAGFPDCSYYCVRSGQTGSLSAFLLSKCSV